MQLGFDLSPPVLPSRPDAVCIDLGREALRRYDDALRRLAHDEADASAQELDELATEMHGGTIFGRAVDDGGAVRLWRALAAPDGTPPLWGQPGWLRVAVAGGVPVDVRFYGLELFRGFDAYAVDAARPFISPTGYRSFISAFGYRPPDHLCAGGPVKAALAIMDAHVTEELKGQLVCLDQTPCHLLPPEAKAERQG